MRDSSGRIGRVSGQVSLGAVVALVALSVNFSARAQSIGEALSAAYQNNPQLLGEQAQLRATDENVPQALSGWRPSVSISTNAGIQHTTAKSGLSSGVIATDANGNPVQSGGNSSSRDNTSSYGLTVTQNLFTGGQTTAQTAQALNLVRAERANLIVVEQTVLVAAATDYVTVLEDQAALDLNINNEQVFRRELEYTRDRFEVGEVTRTDVAQAESSLAQAIAARQQAEASLQIARTTYQQDIGTLPGRLRPPNLTMSLPVSRDEAVNMAVSADPTVIAGQFTKAAAEDNIHVIRSQLLPHITLNATAQRSNDSTNNGRQTDSQSVVAQMNVPLYEGGSVYAQSRQAQQTVTVDQEKVDQARLAAMQSAASAWEQMRSAEANITSFRTQIEANAIALQGVQQEAAVGERTVLDILNAEQTLFQSRVSLIQSQHDELVAKFTLAEALGRFTAKNLALPVALYEPDKNFEHVRNKWIGFDTAQ